MLFGIYYLLNMTYIKRNISLETNWEVGVEVSVTMCKPC
jgi:hypothetical protein